MRSEKRGLGRARGSAHGLGRPQRQSRITVLNEEIAQGRIVYHSASRRYELNGHLPGEVRLREPARRLAEPGFVCRRNAVERGDASAVSAWPLKPYSGTETARIRCRPEPFSAHATRLLSIETSMGR